MPFTKTQSLIMAALAAAPALVSAHGHVTQITVNGETIAGFEPGNPSSDSIGWATTVTDNGFVLADSAISSPDIVCHRGATNAQNSATVAAGDTITITWDTWPESHVGPIIDYLADCNGDCTTVEKTDLEFFKINEGGLLDGSEFRGRWVTDELIENGMKWETTIPPSIAPGSYVLRHEIIALHEGNQQDKAQLYPQCINLEITGSGTAKPAGVVATSLYKSSDAGIFFDPYKTNLVYTIPGPKNTFAGGASPAPAPVDPPASDDDEEEVEAPAEDDEEVEAPAEEEEEVEAPAEEEEVEAPPAPAPTTLATSTRQVAAPTQAPVDECNGNGGDNSGAVALYGQCGGQNYNGPTTCSEGTCVEQNPYYSQCVSK